MNYEVGRQCIKLKSRVKIIEDAILLDMPSSYLEGLLKQLEGDIESLAFGQNRLYAIFTEELVKLTFSMMVKKSKEEGNNNDGQVDKIIRERKESEEGTNNNKFKKMKRDLTMEVENVFMEAAQDGYFY